jgi:hypothetical protein
MRPIRKIAVFGALGSAAVLGWGAWTLLGVEEIPEELEPVGDPSTVVIPGIGDQPELSIAKQRGKTTFFVMVGIATFGSDEGKTVNRALNRWEYPETTEGYIVFDAAGFGFLAEKSQTYLQEFSREARFSMYGDFEGVFKDTFKLSGGHHGLVVLGPDGQVMLRQSGGIEDSAELEKLREMLGASEPEPGPEAPAFEVGSINEETCENKPCALVFLGAPVKRTDVPNIDDGFEGEDEQRWAQMRKPEIRLTSAALRLEPGEAISAALVGEVEELEFPGWNVVDEAPDAREALGIDSDGSAFVIVHAGVVKLRLDGFVPYHRFGEIADHLGVEFKDDD